MKTDYFMKSLQLLILSSFFALCITECHGQSGSIWYFGGGDATSNPTNDSGGLDFTTVPPTALPAGEAPIISLEGCATLSDNYGNVFFYSDGVTCFDRTHTAMPNGGGLSHAGPCDK